MKYINEILTAVSVITLLGAVSCNKEKSVETAGTAIRFGVSTVHENGPATKTEYSGKDENNNSISSTSNAERINWLSTDKIRIGCYHDTPVSSSDDQFELADYQIELSDNGTDQTHAGLSPVDGNGLQWGEGVHDFIALYPSPAQLSGDHAETTALYQDAVAGKIPAIQTAALDGHVFKPDMNYAYMYAIASGVAKGSDVQLDFHPLVTTLEFTLLTKEDDPITSKLTSVKLSSTQSNAYLTGYFCADINKEDGFQSLDPENDVTGGNEITITLPDGGVQLSTTEAYTVTFLTLPMDQTELTLTLNFADETKRTLELKHDGTWITVPACKKTYIWNLDAPNTVVDTYVFAVTNPSDLGYSGGTSTTGSVVSYKYSHGNDIDANRTPVPWEIEGFYSTEDDALDGTNKSDSFSGTYITDFSPSSSTGSYAGESVSISYGAGNSISNTTIDRSSEITAKLKSNTGAYIQRGGPGNYWNLASPTTGLTSSIEETANTYIVNAPGYYCFPLVMGNGIKNGSKNTVAYNQTNFTNYNGTDLSNASSPLLNEQGGTPTGAYIVWEEADMVALDDKTDWTLPSGCITPGSMTIDGETVYWLKFQITDDIQQGCIILAVTDQNDVVMWSWTVWVTDYVPKNYSAYSASSDLADVECTYDAAGNKVTFMPRNLGWVESADIGTLYPETSVFVRLHQTGTTNYAVMEVTKPEGSVLTGGHVGHNPYYQWGRKDALMPDKDTDNTLLSPLCGRTTNFQNSSGQASIATAIKNPATHYRYGSSTNYDWCSTPDNGWWCAGNTEVNKDTPTVKTIYDPCPAGYTIPRYNAFLGFRLGTTSEESPNAKGFDKGYYFWNGYRANDSDPTDEMKTIFFPATGWRNHDSGAVGGLSTYGNSWSAAPGHTIGRGHYLDFNNSGRLVPQFAQARAYGFSVRPSQEE